MFVQDLYNSERKAKKHGFNIEIFHKNKTSYLKIQNAILLVKENVFFVSHCLLFFT